MSNSENAYFTVEAAMVLPIILGVTLLVMYLGFFQYDRCLMEQDIGALALKGCSLDDDNKEKLLQKLDEYAVKLNREKYIAWNHDEVVIKLSGNKVTVSGGGELMFPYANGAIGEKWHSAVVYTNQRIDPVNYIRTYRKLTGGR